MGSFSEEIIAAGLSALTASSFIAKQKVIYSLFQQRETVIERLHFLTKCNCSSLHGIQRGQGIDIHFLFGTFTLPHFAAKSKGLPAKRKMGVCLTRRVHFTESPYRKYVVTAGFKPLQSRAFGIVPLPLDVWARDSFPTFGEAKMGCALPTGLILTEMFAILCLVRMMKNIRNGYLTDRAQELRRNATEQERHLWYAFLHDYPVRFRRQVPIDRFIADFVCSKAKMILELDGSQHFIENGLAYDKERDAILESYGYKVFRIANSEINDNFSGVCEWIDRTVKERMESRTKK